MSPVRIQEMLRKAVPELDAIVSFHVDIPAEAIAGSFGCPQESVYGINSILPAICAIVDVEGGCSIRLIVGLHGSSFVYVFWSRHVVNPTQLMLIALSRLLFENLE